MSERERGTVSKEIREEETSFLWLGLGGGYKPNVKARTSRTLELGLGENGGMLLLDSKKKAALGKIFTTRSFTAWWNLTRGVKGRVSITQDTREKEYVNMILCYTD